MEFSLPHFQLRTRVVSVAGKNKKHGTYSVGSTISHRPNKLDSHFLSLHCNRSTVSLQIIMLLIKNKIKVQYLTHLSNTPSSQIFTYPSSSQMCVQGVLGVPRHTLMSQNLIFCASFQKSVFFKVKYCC